MLNPVLAHLRHVLLMQRSLLVVIVLDYARHVIMLAIVLTLSAVWIIRMNALQALLHVLVHVKELVQVILAMEQEHVILN